MTTNRKTVNGIEYRLTRREDPGLAESGIYWRGEDGSELDLTDEEHEERDTDKSIADD